MEQKTFSGIALNEKFKNGKTPGQIILTGHSIRFQSDEGSVELPLQDLIINRGGSSGQLVTFEHQAYPGWYIYTREKSIIGKLKRNSTSDFTPRVKEYKKANMRARSIILVTILTIAALLLLMLQVRNPFSKTIAQKIPVEWEQALGEAVFKQYTAQKKLITDPEVLGSLAKITTPLLNRIPDKRYDFKIHIIQDVEINAFALPGGYVLLHTGLLQTVGNAEELLGVLAHEIAHVTLRHGLRKLIDSLGLFLMMKAFFGNLGGAWGDILESSAFLLNQKFSRSFEKEADEKSFVYLLDAGIDPGGMIGFFERLEVERKKIDKINLEEKLNFLSTHPAPSARIDSLNKKLKQLGKGSNFKNFDPEFREFQDTVKRKIKPLKAK